MDRATLSKICDAGTSILDIYSQMLELLKGEDHCVLYDLDKAVDSTRNLIEHCSKHVK